MMLLSIKGQNEMKQELFGIRNDQRTVPIVQCDKDTSKNKSYAEVASAAASNSIPNISPKVPQPQQIPGHQGNLQMPLQDQQESYSSPKAFPASAKQCQDSSKILFVGDSISGNINIKKIENATGREIVCKKAYSAIHDTKKNVAKKAAIFPASNFTDVVPDMLVAILAKFSKSMQDPIYFYWFPILMTPLALERVNFKLDQFWFL